MGINTYDETKLFDSLSGVTFSFELIGDTKPEIKKVIYNNPATIILWTDGTKTVAKCDDVDKYDPEIGFKICVMKKFVTGKKWNWMLDIIYGGNKCNG